MDTVSLPSRHDAPPTAPAAPLVLAVEATRLAKEVRGIGRYVRALIPRFVAQRPGIRITLYVKGRDVRRLAADYAGNPVTAGAVDVRPIREFVRAPADVFWYPWNVAVSTPRRGAVVVTMHDVAPLVLRDPRFWKWRKNMRWRTRYRVTAARATLLVVDSSFTADEVHRELGVSHDRMRVVLLAADDARPSPESEDAEQLALLGVRKPFVLTVGAGDRRKNIALVERAIPRVVPAHPELTLVLAGPRTDKQRAAARHPWMQHLGFVSDGALSALYRNASCLVMPSRYEGFGLPVLEAMQMGTPVICARTSSLPEVGGDAVLWVDPDDDAQLVASMVEVVGDARVSARLSAAGRVQASRFTWDETARRTLDAFDEARAMDTAAVAK